MGSIRVFQDTPPPPGTLTQVAPGLLWLRLPLPYRLDHVNVYLIEDGDGWAVFDTGLGDQVTREIWESLLAGPLSGRGLTRMIVSHFHPDHVGLAGWLAARFDLPLHMSQTEYLFSRVLGHAPAAAEREVHRIFYVRRGLDPEIAEQVVGKGHEYLDCSTGLPPAYRRLFAGQVLRIGGREFEVITGGGHSQEQAMLVCRAERLFLAADQVLARITPNISIWAMEPEGDTLGDYVASLRAIRADLPDDMLVLACHNLPFWGLHRRIDELLEHHASRCAAILEAVRGESRTAAELVPVLFHRPLDPHQLGFAFRETLAHVNYMLRQGELQRDIAADGMQRVRAVG
jgi:glyoxylase-like metal-dependent hydrolase (beta-lactamase superfamily II)